MADRLDITAGERLESEVERVMELLGTRGLYST